MIMRIDKRGQHEQRLDPARHSVADGKYLIVMNLD